MVLGAVITSFAFGMAAGVTRAVAIAVSTQQQGDDIILTCMGGEDNPSLARLNVTGAEADGTAIDDSFANTPPAVGDTLTISDADSADGDHVELVDGSRQIVPTSSAELHPLLRSPASAGPITDPGRSISTGSDQKPAGPLYRSPAPARRSIIDPRRSISTGSDQKPDNPRNPSPAPSHRPIVDPRRSIINGSDRKPADSLLRSPAPAGSITDPGRSTSTGSDQKPDNPRNRSPRTGPPAHRRSAPLGERLGPPIAR